MKENNKPSWREIISFALGDGGCNLVWTTIGHYIIQTALDWLQQQSVL